MPRTPARTASPTRRRARGPAALTAAVAAVGLAAPGAHAWSPAGVVDDPVTVVADDARISLEPLGSYATGVFDESAAEIVAYHARSERLFSVNARAAEVTALDVSDPGAPRRLFAVQTAGLRAADGSRIPAGAVANSVAVRADGLGVVAVESDVKTDAGWLVLFDAAGDGSALAAVRVGALPDMVTVAPDGRTAVVANEGEPADDFSVDPEGSVSVVDLPRRLTGKHSAITQEDVRTAGFHAFEGDALPDGVRVTGPDVADASGSSAFRVSRNLEPEYVTVPKGSRTAYVTLQEANAVAVVDLRSATVTDVLPLGTKDHSLPGQGLDPSDEDGAADVRELPVRGLYMPDGVASYTSRGETYLVTANEGDAREWGDYEDAARVKDLGDDGLAPVCDDSPAAGLLDDADLGRLDVSVEDGLRPDGSCYGELYAFGARSFSVWTTDGEQVFDSGDDFERVTADALGDAFNTDHSETSFEGRSDNKGPEPEAVTVGKVAGRTYAFVGLERASGIMVYDVTVPAESSFVTYVSNRDYSVSVEDAVDDGADPASTLASAGDLGPEGMAFVPAGASPTHRPVLAVANEVSGTTTLFEVDRLTGRR
ncbi:choice-of-anchor I family protein [Isoptericola sp. BMS4]|uniref:choice-of-anchor I family protein n=1 Tax=Isoptericola sp. BMS4 TaxID=2527875 RepID=UPI00196BA57F|nr:choice-of-anchor I family protein [Isoptericola sp. BMS4]